jgi:hypothetical protein
LSAEEFVNRAITALAPPITQRERDLQGLCHELLEIIEGQDDLTEDAQFTIGYASHLDGGYEDTIGGAISHMQQAKQIAKSLYDNTFNCRRARERVGLETER